MYGGSLCVNANLIAMVFVVSVILVYFCSGTVVVEEVLEVR